MLLFSLLLALAEPAELTHANCDDPQKRAQLLAMEPDDLPATKAMKAGAEANQKRFVDLLNRLAVRAKLTDQQKADIALQLLELPAFKAAFTESMDAIKPMMANLDQMMQSKDPVKNCHLLVGMTEQIPAINATTAKQWAVFEAYIRGEAAKRGVSLDD